MSCDVDFIIDTEEVEFILDGYIDDCLPVTVTDYLDDEVGTILAGEILQVIAKDTNNNILTATYTLLNGVLTLSGINIEGSTMISFTNVTTELQNAAFADKSITDFVVLISGTDWVTSGSCTKTFGSDTIDLSVSAEGAIATVLYQP